jgi:hypothetical protein
MGEIPSGLTQLPSLRWGREGSSHDLGWSCAGGGAGAGAVRSWAARNKSCPGFTVVDLVS